jgi:hypothetical protein
MNTILNANEQIKCVASVICEPKMVPKCRDEMLQVMGVISIRNGGGYKNGCYQHKKWWNIHGY